MELHKIQHEGISRSELSLVKEPDTIEGNKKLLRRIKYIRENIWYFNDWKEITQKVHGGYC